MNRPPASTASPTINARTITLRSLFGSGAAGGGGDAAGGGLAGLAGGASPPDQASELVFRGRGAVQASAAERRMIGEWTRAVAVEAVGDRIVLTRATADYQDAWAAYQAVEPRYRNAKRKLAE